VEQGQGMIPVTACRKLG